MGDEATASKEGPKTLTFKMDSSQGRPVVRAPTIDLDFKKQLPRSVQSVPQIAGETFWAEAPIAGLRIPIGAARSGKAGLQLLVDRNGDGALEGDDIEVSHEMSIVDTASHSAKT